MKRPSSKQSRTKPKRDPSPYPKGWNRKRVQSVIDYYENQTDDEAVAEAEAAYRSTGSAMIQVPIKFVGQVRKLIAKRAG